jgi:hypothetical protein
MFLEITEIWSPYLIAYVVGSKRSFKAILTPPSRHCPLIVHWNSGSSMLETTQRQCEHHDRISQLAW